MGSATSEESVSVLGRVGVDSRIPAASSLVVTHSLHTTGGEEPDTLLEFQIWIAGVGCFSFQCMEEAEESVMGLVAVSVLLRAWLVPGG